MNLKEIQNLKLLITKLLITLFKMIIEVFNNKFRKKEDNIFLNS